MRIMSVHKTIAIVGVSGETEFIVAGRLASAGYHILLVSKEEAGSAGLGKDMNPGAPGADVEWVDCVRDGCWEADIIILWVPPDEEATVAEMIREVATQKIVVHFSKGTRATEELQQRLPYSKLVCLSDQLDQEQIGIGGTDRQASEEIAGILEVAGYLVTSRGNCRTDSYLTSGNKTEIHP
jgi:predicted CoA-binding protein